MSKTWTMWAVVFVGAGMSGLGLVAWNLYQEDKDLQPYRNQFNQNDDEYLRLYEEWSRLTPEQKVDNPWGQGQYGGSKTSEQIRSDNPPADVDLVDLATGAKEPHVWPICSMEQLAESGSVSPEKKFAMRFLWLHCHPLAGP
jgi:hypothetical protein